MSALPEFEAANDPDALETQEWVDALEAVLEREGPERAHFLLEKMIEKTRMSGAYLPFSPNTPYVNTIPAHLEDRSPGDPALEERIRSYCRWNAMVMVAKANKNDDELGGHIASFASVGTLFGVGQNHFWNAPHDGHGGDLVYFQGHSSPGIYGAKPAMPSRARLDPDTPDEKALTSKVAGVRLKKGMRVAFELGGGGGYGNPLERDPERVRTDVLRGYVTREGARKSYGVALRDDLSIDAAATQALRSGAAP